MDQFLIELSSNGQSPSIQWGSMLHGLLMENLPSPWPTELHLEDLRPFSQWVEIKSSDCFIWHINSLRDELSNAIEFMLQQKNKYEIKHAETFLAINNVEKRHTTMAEFMKSFFLTEEACPGVFMVFRTPTTHKTMGQYAVFPSVELIAGNLRKRLCALAPDFALADDQAFEQVLQHTRLQRYKLESARYQLEGTGVIGYTGRIELRFMGPDPLRRLAGALYSFANWSGVGIKTALGMGGCVVSIKERKVVK